jgi:hypothetical protein
MSRGLTRGALSLATGRRGRLAAVLAALLAAAPLSSAQTQPSPPAALPGEISPEGAEMAGAPPSHRGAPTDVPFRVAGIVIGPAAKLAQVVILDPSGRPTKVRTVREGSKVEGYVIAAIAAKSVDVERDGLVFSLAIDNPSPIEQEAATPTQDAEKGAEPPADSGDIDQPVPTEAADAESPESAPESADR